MWAAREAIGSGKRTAGLGRSAGGRRRRCQRIEPAIHLPATDSFRRWGRSGAAAALFVFVAVMGSIGAIRCGRPVGQNDSPPARATSRAARPRPRPAPPPSLRRRRPAGETPKAKSLATLVGHSPRRVSAEMGAASKRPHSSGRRSARFDVRSVKDYCCQRRTRPA